MRERKLHTLPTFANGSDLVNIVIEVTKGTRTKLKYDDQDGVFRAEKVLPVGLVFPFDFGFLPSTLGGDGDPLDVLVLSESGLPFGSVVLGRLIAVQECEQTERGKTNRNDRLIAIPIDAKSEEPMEPSVEFDDKLNVAISDFFVKYNELQGKRLRPLGNHGSGRAKEIVKQGMQLAKRSKNHKK